jgi:hypothetical protein
MISPAATTLLPDDYLGESQKDGDAENCFAGGTFAEEHEGCHEKRIQRSGNIPNALAERTQAVRGS